MDPLEFGIWKAHAASYINYISMYNLLQTAYSIIGLIDALNLYRSRLSSIKLRKSAELSKHMISLSVIWSPIDIGRHHHHVKIYEVMFFTFTVHAGLYTRCVPFYWSIMMRFHRLPIDSFQKRPLSGDNIRHTNNNHSAAIVYSDV